MIYFVLIFIFLKFEYNEMIRPTLAEHNCFEKELFDRDSNSFTSAPLGYSSLVKGESSNEFR